MPAFTYEENRAWADQFLEPIKDIIRRNAHDIIEAHVASQEQDTQEATDFVVRVEKGAIGVRVRRPECTFREFTINTDPTRKVCELEKILAGTPRWFLYCWTARAEDGRDRICEWMFLDLDTLRKSWVLDGCFHAWENSGRSKPFAAVSIDELIEVRALVRYEREILAL